MTLVISGAISFNDVNTELRRTAIATLELNDAGVRALAGIAASPATIAMTNLQGKQYRVSISVAITTQTTDYTLTASSLSGYYAGISDITLTVGAILLYASSTGTYALTWTGFTAGDTFNLVNNGTIAGHGGNGGAGYAGVGGAGGGAINSGYAGTINSPGSIGGGGGGGGGGSAPPAGGGGGGGGGAGGGTGMIGYNSTSYGGNGGWTIPGVGGGGGYAAISGGIWSGYPGSAGGGGGSGISTCAGGIGGSGGAGGSLGTGTAPNYKCGGGGGGWGASGASGGPSNQGAAGGGGGGGKAINLNGTSITWSGGFPSTRVFGVIS